MYGTLTLKKLDFSTNNKIVQIVGIILPNFYSSIDLYIFALISKSFKRIGLLENRVIRDTHLPQLLLVLNS